MISRGEVGLIVAGVAISAEAITQSTYAAILGMIMITTVLAPLLLRRSYEKDPFEEATTTSEEDSCSPDYIPTYPLQDKPIHSEPNEQSQLQKDRNS